MLARTIASVCPFDNNEIPIGDTMIGIAKRIFPFSFFMVRANNMVLNPLIKAVANLGENILRGINTNVAHGNKGTPSTQGARQFRREGKISSLISRPPWGSNCQEITPTASANPHTIIRGIRFCRTSGMPLFMVRSSLVIIIASNQLFVYIYPSTSDNSGRRYIFFRIHGGHCTPEAPLLQGGSTTNKLYVPGRQDRPD